MKSSLLASLLVTGLALAQAPATPQAPPSTPPAVSLPVSPIKPQAFNLQSLPPETVLATVDGRKVTAADLQGLLRGMPPQMQRQAMMNPMPFLHQYGLLRRLTALAEEEKLDQKSPYKEQIEYNRMVTLAQAELADRQSHIQITPEEIQQTYDTNQDRYAQAKVKAIYIPFSANPPKQDDPNAKKVLTEAEAKEKAAKLLADLRAGADFVQMVKEHSGDKNSAAKDGDFGVIRKSDRLADPIKTAVFALNPGELSEPVRQPNGYYLFRVEETGVQPFDEVKQQITGELRQARFDQWMKETQKTIEIRIEHQDLLRQAMPAPPAGPMPGVAPAAPQPPPVKK